MNQLFVGPSACWSRSRMPQRGFPCQRKIQGPSPMNPEKKRNCGTSRCSQDADADAFGDEGLRAMMHTVARHDGTIMDLKKREYYQISRRPTYSCLQGFWNGSGFEVACTGIQVLAVSDSPDFRTECQGRKSVPFMRGPGIQAMTLWGVNLESTGF